jgi:hypothetical protein
MGQSPKESLKPLDIADWNVIGDAILLLKREKNGRFGQAKVLLRQLKGLGHYNALLEDWTD